MRIRRHSKSSFLPVLWSLELNMAPFLEQHEEIDSRIQCFKVNILQVYLQAVSVKN